MKQLKIAFLWHQHQPYYKLNGEYKLPWVRLHAIKDYLDMCLILNEYPKIKQTFNLVPSLMMQIEDYKNDNANESILELTKKEAAKLTQTDKNEILKSFFICNQFNMIEPHERYHELYKKSLDGTIADFSAQDWLDIQVWYTLTWFGPVTKERSEIKYLIAKQKNFSEDDKHIMLMVQRQVLNDIIPTYRRLLGMGNIEISVSPMYHPILPLLCDTNSALESSQEMKLPTPAFCFPEDAYKQIAGSVSYFESEFGHKPSGMWPSEGAVSNKVLEMIAENGINWIATDEKIMMNATGGGADRLERFFPRKIIINDKELHIIFREHFLSDLIGFQYSSLDAESAAEDFVNRLKYVRWELVSRYGEDCLDSAVVPIIMDGENCWEFYKENGKPFLDDLYRRLCDDEQITTIKMSEALNYHREYVEPLKSIKAGSWIDGDFSVWMGQEEHVRAWSALRDVRNLYEAKKNDLPENLKIKIEETFAIAEGSDWFWWYSDSHQAPNKHDFDVMFREHLINIYKLMEIEPPVEVGKPFGKTEGIQLLKQAERQIKSNKNFPVPDVWDGCGYYLAGMSLDAMHSGGAKIKIIKFGNDEQCFYFNIETEGKLLSDERIIIEILNQDNQSIVISSETEYKDFAGQTYNYFVRIPFNQISMFEVQFKYICKTGITNYPRQGTLKFDIINNI